MAKKNTTGLPTGAYVKRSTYQKVCEENKKLKADIFLLVEKPNSLKGITAFAKWKDVFKEENKLKEFQFFLGQAIRTSMLKCNP